MRSVTLRPFFHLLVALPLIVLVLRWSALIAGTSSRIAGLSAEPIDFTINYLGLWAIRLLLLTMCIGPLARKLRSPSLMALRRPAGLWTFTYALIHLGVYLGLDLLGDLALLWEDVIKHRFILFGMAAFLLLAPLAVTSTHRWIRRIGARRWQKLHRLVYGAALLAAAHFILRVKGFQVEPWIYAGCFAILLLIRALPILRKKLT